MMANNEFCNADKHENPLRGSAVKKNKKIYIMEMSCGSQVGGDIQQSPAHICSYQ